MEQLGGRALYLGLDEVRPGDREPAADVARVWRLLQQAENRRHAQKALLAHWLG